MNKIVFILGLPGSGKSAAASYLEQITNDKWNVFRFNDYKYLLEMAKADKDGLRFSSTKDKGHQGFDVHDLKAFDEALKILRDNVLRILPIKQSEKNDLRPSRQIFVPLVQLINKFVRMKRDTLIIIEFSRNDYCRALEFFKSINLSQNTFFLFADANISACKQRIKSRVEKPQTSDDYYVSEYIFEAYYQRDRREYLRSTANYLKQQFDVPPEHIHVVKNSQSQSLISFQRKVKSAILPFLYEAEDIRLAETSTPSLIVQSLSHHPISLKSGTPAK